MSGWRFSPLHLLRGHWKVLSVPGTNLSVSTDHVARWTFGVVSGGLLIASLVGHWTLKSPDALLAGVALLAGGLIGAFGQVAGWRDQVRQVNSDFEPSPEVVVRQDSIDETATHLLLAAYLSGVEALLIVIGLNVAVDSKTGSLTGFVSALTIAIGAYLALLYLLIVPRLYSAYVEVNEVRRVLNGQAR